MSFWQLALNNVTRNFKVYFAFFLSCVVSIMIFFLFAIYIFHPKVWNPGRNYLLHQMITAEEMIFLFFYIYILYAINILVKVRSKEFGILMFLGISKKQFNKLILLEIIIIGFFSIITGIVLGLVFSNFFLIVSEKIVIMNLLHFYFPVKAIFLTVISFTILFLIISVSIPVLLRTNKIIGLLREPNKGDKEIRFSKIMVSASILLLGSGYLMAISKRFQVLSDFFNKISNNIGYQILFIVFSITIGTFLFFSQFSVFVIERLKKRRSFYMKKVNMIWISDLAFSMRKNARFLFFSTIILTVTFTSIAALYSRNARIIDNVIENYPMQFIYLSKPGNDREQQHIKIIEDSLKNGEFKFKKYTAVVLQQRMDDKEQIHIIKLSEYTEFATALNIEKIYLKENEAYIVQFPYKYNGNIDKLSSSKSLSLNNGTITLTSVGAVEKNIFTSVLFSRLIVVNNNTFKTLENICNKNIYYGFQIEDWEKTSDIDRYIQKKINPKYDDPFSINGVAAILEDQKEAGRVHLYIALFVAVIFLFANGSYLYFRVYITLNQEKEKYISISKIGLALEEMKKTATIQIALLFFIPYILAAVHTYFFLEILELFQGIDLKLFIILFIFFVIQFIYFLIIRSRYIKQLSRVIL